MQNVKKIVVVFGDLLRCCRVLKLLTVNIFVESGKKEAKITFNFRKYTNE